MTGKIAHTSMQPAKPNAMPPQKSRFLLLVR